MTVRGTRDSYEWKKIRARQRRYYERHPDQAICWLCLLPIDMRLRSPHPLSFSLDHIVPVSKVKRVDGEIKPAHRRCNEERGTVNSKAAAMASIPEWAV